MKNYFGEVCVYFELGWLDKNYNWTIDGAQMDLDAASAASEVASQVAAGINPDKVQECMANVIVEMTKDKSWKKCFKKYKGKGEKLQRLVWAVAGIKYTTKIFVDNCHEFVGGKINEALSDSTTRKRDMLSSLW